MKPLLVFLALTVPSWAAIALNPSSLTFTGAPRQPLIAYAQDVAVTGSGSFSIVDLGGSCAAAGLVPMLSTSSGSATATVAIRFRVTSLLKAVGSYECTLEFASGVNLGITFNVERNSAPNQYPVTTDHVLLSAVCTNPDTTVYVYNDVCTATPPAFTGVRGDTVIDPFTGSELLQVSDIGCYSSYYNQNPISPDGLYIMARCNSPGTSTGIGFALWKMDGTGAAYGPSLTDSSILSPGSCWWYDSTHFWCAPDNQDKVYSYAWDAGMGTLTRSTVYTHASNFWVGGSSKPSSDGWLAVFAVDSSSVYFIDIPDATSYSFSISALEDPFSVTGCPGSDTNCIDHVDMAPGIDASGCHYAVMNIPANGNTGQWARAFKHCTGDMALSVASQGWGNADDGNPAATYQDPHLNAANPSRNVTGQHMGLYQVGNVQYASFQLGFNMGNTVSSFAGNNTWPLASGNSAATVAGGFKGYQSGGQTIDGKSCGYIQVCLYGNTPESASVTNWDFSGSCTAASGDVTCTSTTAHGLSAGTAIRIGGTQGMTGLRGTQTLISGTTGSTIKFTASTTGTHTSGTGGFTLDTAFASENSQGRGIFWMREDNGHIVMLTKGYSEPFSSECGNGNYFDFLHFVQSPDGSKIAFSSNGRYPCEFAIYTVNAPLAITIGTAPNEFNDSGSGVFVTPYSTTADVAVTVPSSSLGCTFEHSLYSDLSSPTTATGTAATTWSFGLTGLTTATQYFYRGYCDDFYYGTGTFTTSAGSGGIRTTGNVRISGAGR